MKGYLTPYKGPNICYHLCEFCQGNQAACIPKRRQEKFNYFHSSLRNIVERAFGVWKARWAIMNDMPYYDFDDQLSSAKMINLENK
ncbi:hypothetical protein RJ639_043449 [Escallonia herrerae]|uniref:DDE Tnp4 domain-containing protein n=1 Tax=Escallonia herrerae TaxID=1293975 RepID=A0AA89B2F5_9ASTE|nr:hypothetical protein RJ639_043449 [Escallonia herrerae]